MKKFKPNLPLTIGLLTFSVTQIINHTSGIPHGLQCFLIGVTIVLEIWGIVLLMNSPAIKNSKLRRWKLNLFYKIIGHNNSR